MQERTEENITIPNNALSEATSQAKDEVDTESDVVVSAKKIKTSLESDEEPQQVLEEAKTTIFDQGNKSEIENQTTDSEVDEHSTLVLSATEDVAVNGEVNLESTAKPKKKPSTWSILLKAFRELGLPSPSSPDTWLEFGALKKLLYDPKVIVVTTKILNVGLKIKDDESRQRARVLLTSYMTLMCPHEVLQNVDGEEEKNLHASAQRMLYLFEAWLRAHGRPGATAARLRFVDAWNDYFILFEAWKSRDRDQLVNSMITYYLELLSLKDTSKKQSDDNAVNGQLDEQLEQVKHKIKELGGDGAIASLERAVNLAQQLNLAASRSTERRKQATPRSSDAVGKQDENTQAEPYTNQLNQVITDFAPESSSNMLNEQIAHELIMNPSFKLTRPESSSELEARVREMVEKAYFERVAQDMEQGRLEEFLLPLISDIREQLLSLVRPQGHLYQKINDVLDLPLIRQQMKEKIFDIDGAITFILDVMSKICAPVRDEEIQKIKAEPKIIEKVAAISKLLDSMNLDLSNFRLQSLRPHLISIAVEYEREKFAEMLNNGTIQLVNTKKWLTDSVCRLCETANHHPEESPVPKSKPSHKLVFEDAFIHLLSEPKPISILESVPETFRLDKKRLTEYQNEIQAITIVASLIFLVKNFGCKNSQRLSELTNNLFTILQDDDISIDNLIAEIERAVQVDDDEKRQMIRSMVDKTVSHTDTIYLLLYRRVISVIKSTIQSGRFVTDTVISSYSLDFVRQKLEELAKQILRLSEHNQKVHATWYDNIISVALNEHYK